jgi:hypothetical protein
MDISTFDDLLQAARQQPEPQRLLFVFAGASLPDDATPEQRKSFEAGESGELAPLMCVDKDARDLPGFDALVAEAALAGPSWALVFAAALGGQHGEGPPASRVETALQIMVESVRSGDVDRLIPFDRGGHAVRLA